MFKQRLIRASQRPHVRFQGVLLSCRLEMWLTMEHQNDMLTSKRIDEIDDIQTEFFWSPVAGEFPIFSLFNHFKPQKWIPKDGLWGLWRDNHDNSNFQTSASNGDFPRWCLCRWGSSQQWHLSSLASLSKSQRPNGIDQILALSIWWKHSDMVESNLCGLQDMIKNQHSTPEKEKWRNSPCIGTTWNWLQFHRYMPCFEPLTSTSKIGLQGP